MTFLGCHAQHAGLLCMRGVAQVVPPITPITAPPTPITKAKAHLYAMLGVGKGKLHGSDTIALIVRERCNSQVMASLMGHEHLQAPCLLGELLGRAASPVVANQQSSQLSAPALSAAADASLSMLLPSKASGMMHHRCVASKNWQSWWYA